MYQNYGYQQQQQPYSVARPAYQNNQVSNTIIGIKGRPVTSLEEARACMIDFDGSIFYFPDIANKKIYTKQIGMDGSAIINIYELTTVPVQAPVEMVQTNDFITRNEFEQAITQLKENLRPPAQPNVQTSSTSSQNGPSASPQFELNF